jgi:F420-dependent oxidoreductase-like protein
VISGRSRIIEDKLTQAADVNSGRDLPVLKFGLQIPWFSWDGAPDNHRSVLRDIAQSAEEAGFSSLWVMDHFFQLPMIGDADLDMNESYTTLGFLAGVTEKVTLSPLVTGVTYRHPGPLVKQVTTLDVLSSGRAWCGIGAAWFEREHRGLGVPFPPLAERFERLEETLEIALQMWSEEDGPYKGKHFTLEETICSPRPIQKPHPPILIGGGGEKRTLRLVARYAQATNLFGGPDEMHHKFDVLRRHCDDVGRNYDEIERTRLSTAFPGADIVDECRALEEVGVQHLIFNAPRIDTLEPIRYFEKEVIPAFQD